MELVPALRSEIDRRVDFIKTYVALGESHMVDFFVMNHWNTLVDPFVQQQLMHFDENDLHSAKNVMKMYNDNATDRPASQNLSKSYIVQNLKEYFDQAQACAIENSAFCKHASSIDKTLRELTTNRESKQTKMPNDVSHLVSTNEYMCNKKSHEVDEMSSLVNILCQKLGITNILDIGSGKGYLGTHLSLKYGLDVIGVDCSDANSTNANARAAKFLKYWNAYLKNKSDGHFESKDMKYHPITVSVNADSDVNFLLTNQEARDLNLQKELLLTGLHICGDLSSTALRMFVNKPQIKAVCSLGCCYHLLTNADVTKECGFPMSVYLKEMNFSLGRNTKMLGLKALDRIQDADVAATEEKSTRSLFYRAVLSVILEKEFNFEPHLKDFKVGKVYSKSKNFIDYVRKCLSKLGISQEASKYLSDDMINSHMKAMEGSKKTLLAFNVLREAFGPAVEALILLDKLLYLHEQNFPNSHLVKLFDPVKSPRCYAIVSVKS